MRGILLIFAVLFSFIISVALVKDRPKQPSVISIVTASAEEPIEEEKILEDQKPPMVVIPRPIIIDNFFDVSKIDDVTLRNMVRRKADFRIHKVLYFVWEGDSNERMDGMMSKENFYRITLHPSQMESKEMIHKQIFIIPTSVDFSLEMSEK